MSNTDKITASHLQRDAWLYVRQSTLRQVVENTESTRRQYALRDRAVALGWPLERIHTIDSDLGESAAGHDREGFRQLTAEVATGGAGIVLGLEVSRLARNSSDWHRLLELCAFSDTLILDEDGLYNPSDFNDRLLLGLKGTMSEAELHVLHSRLRGGILNKARRGELKIPLPVGLVYDPLNRVALDPDAQVRESVRCVFDTFKRVGSGSATVRHFREQNLMFPSQGCGAPRNRTLFWQPLTHSRVLQVLHNPRYAGAFVFGRSVTRRNAEGGRKTVSVAQDQWPIVIHDAHPGYISWDQYQLNQQQLRNNAQAYGGDRRSAPREGPALIQGMVICGHCGERMTVRYHNRVAGKVPSYVCQRQVVEHAGAICQNVPGAGIDRTVGELLAELMTETTTLEAAIGIQDELARRADEADGLRAREVQRAAEEAQIAQQRFMQTHPDNRMVADVLEAEWNEALRAHRDAQHDYERQRNRGNELEQQQRETIMSLAADFPLLWNDPHTPQRERKRMVRLLIDDVTLTSHDDATIALGIRLRGGAVRTLRIARELPAWQKYQTPASVVAEIDALLDEHTEGEIAEILNRRGTRSGQGRAFNVQIVAGIRRKHRLQPRLDRLRERGFITAAEAAQTLGVSVGTINKRRRDGLIHGCRINDKNEYLVELPMLGTTPKIGRPPKQTQTIPEKRI